ncbi:MAG: AmmeMemoRadiSam system radical SAM enzyme [Deltaproteobacteria bacterium]|nr:AmmeMemoRadiSam system radical SAM enzyme [Deltaproteobacteria bacterium]
MKKASYWKKLDDKAVRCELCPHRCIIKEGGVGVCGVRKNIEGELYTLVWPKAVAANVDPIEKKPFFHVLPGTLAYSIATVGCNFRCRFCQNSDISQYPILTGKIAGDELPPAEVVGQAKANGCASIAYTYTEPTVFMEYVIDTARLSAREGMLNLLVTNGYISTDIIRQDLKGLIDGANIDLKSFSDRFYRRLCAGRLQHVLDSIRAYHESGIWLEITTLVIPGENDSMEELKDIAGFIRSVSSDIPWHVSRYFPRYLYDKAPPTPLATIEMAREIGLSEGLKFVYTGNIASSGGEDTYCPECGSLLISRTGFFVKENNIKNGRCNRCNNVIPGRFQ